MIAAYVEVKDETQWVLLQQLAFAYGKSWSSVGQEVLNDRPHKYLAIYKDDSDICHAYSVFPGSLILSIPEWIQYLKKWPDDIVLTINGKEIELSIETTDKIREAIGDE